MLNIKLNYLLLVYNFKTFCVPTYKDYKIINNSTQIMYFNYFRFQYTS